MFPKIGTKYLSQYQKYNRALLFSVLLYHIKKAFWSEWLCYVASTYKCRKSVFYGSLGWPPKIQHSLWDFRFDSSLWEGGTLFWLFIESSCSFKVSALPISTILIQASPLWWLRWIAMQAKPKTPQNCVGNHNINMKTPGTGFILLGQWFYHKEAPIYFPNIFFLSLVWSWFDLLWVTFQGRTFLRGCVHQRAWMCPEWFLLRGRAP